MNIEILPGKDDGELHENLSAYIYLHLIVKVDGEDDGRLSGYFLPGVIAFIKEALGAGNRDYTARARAEMKAEILRAIARRRSGAVERVAIELDALIAEVSKL